jgi:hypothetical protein
MNPSTVFVLDHFPVAQPVNAQIYCRTTSETHTRTRNADVVLTHGPRIACANYTRNMPGLLTKPLRPGRIRLKHIRGLHSRQRT